MPSFLLQKIPDATICFYMHQPWPSSELFRTLSVREEILLGMLNSDIIVSTHAISTMAWIPGAFLRKLLVVAGVSLVRFRAELPDGLL